MAPCRAPSKVPYLYNPPEYEFVNGSYTEATTSLDPGNTNVDPNAVSL